MRIFVILAVVCVTVLADPEGYTYKKSAPLLQHGNLDGSQPISGHGLPCNHAPHQTRNAALIQVQSTGRILNHQHHNSDNNLVAAASGINPQLQAVTVNSQVVVGERGSAASGISGGSYEYQSGQGHLQDQFAGQSSVKVPFQQQLPQPQFQKLPQYPSHSPAQPLILGNLAPGRVVPSQVLSGQMQGYSYNQGSSASQINQDIYHHYLQPVASTIVNGIGKVAPPPQNSINKPTQGVEYASGYSGNSFLSPQIDHIIHNGPTDLRPQVSYHSQGITLNGLVNFADHRPLKNAGIGYAGNFQHGSNSYTGSFNHNTISDSSKSYTSGSQFGSILNENLSNGLNIGLFNSVPTAGSALDGQLGHVIYDTFANAPLDPTIEKHIYVHVPPEDIEDNVAKHTAFLPTQKAKKHYKIIFIKAPSAPQPNYVQLASAAAQQTEVKTLVYVLVKKPDEPSLEEIKQIQQTVHKPSKPEVYFIKYKTRKENEAHLPTFPTNSGSSDSGSEQYNSGKTFSGFSGYNSKSGGIESNEGIDLRVGGETSLISSPNSFSTSLNSLSSSNLNEGVSIEKKHELYGVPLE